MQEDNIFISPKTREKLNQILDQLLDDEAFDPAKNKSPHPLRAKAIIFMIL
jgi:hypothetical protein